MNIHRIAVPVDAGLVAAEIGATKQMYFFDIDSTNHIVQESMIVFPEDRLADVPGFLIENSANEIILGDMPQELIDVFLENQIGIVLGAPSNKPKLIVEDFLLQIQHQHDHHHNHEHGDGGCGCDSGCGCH